eukprot:TRINITY_DN120454_c0_g1_i1.p1 TRINITY_DN120454_c0_g1~~TRINITY_DN120454_c0_g1_i1.p1  ORF type:complete len:480 (+),score=41.90 TRINITY_DN120454_c0_g1_i1:1371-2810(+)
MEHYILNNAYLSVQVTQLLEVQFLIKKIRMKNSQKRATRPIQPTGSRPPLSPGSKFVLSIGQTMDFLTARGAAPEHGFERKDELLFTDRQHLTKWKRKKNTNVFERLSSQITKMHEKPKTGDGKSVLNVKTKVKGKKDKTKVVAKVGKKVTAEQPVKSVPLMQSMDENCDFLRSYEKFERSFSPKSIDIVSSHKKSRTQDLDRFLTKGKDKQEISIGKGLSPISSNKDASSVTHRIRELIEERRRTREIVSTEYKSYKHNVPIPRESHTEAKAATKLCRSEIPIPNKDYGGLGISLTEASRLEKERRIINAILEQKGAEKNYGTNRAGIMEKIARRMNKTIDFRVSDKETVKGALAVEMRGKYWQTMKDNEIETEREKKAAKEFKECTFKPKITPKGQKVLRDKSKEKLTCDLSREEINILNKSNSYKKISQVINRAKKCKGLSKTQGSNRTMSQTSDFISMLADDIKKETHNLLIRKK